MVAKSFNLFLVFVFITLISGFTCKNSEVQSPDTRRDEIDHNHYSFLALGDSYTIGQSVAIQERFPAQAQYKLNAVGKQVTDVMYIAATGWTTTNLIHAIEEKNLQKKFDIVTLLIGVNDQNRFHDTTGYSDRFTLLLENAIQFAHNNKDHVFVLSIPDYSVTPFGRIDDTVRIHKEIDLFNNINRRITDNYAVSYTDITPLSREALTDPSLIARDSLHPSGKMYAKWAEVLAPEIKMILK